MRFFCHPSSAGSHQWHQTFNPDDCKWKNALASYELVAQRSDPPSGGDLCIYSGIIVRSLTHYGLTASSLHQVNILKFHKSISDETRLMKHEYIFSSKYNVMFKVTPSVSTKWNFSNAKRRKENVYVKMEKLCVSSFYNIGGWVNDTRCSFIASNLECLCLENEEEKFSNRLNYFLTLSSTNVQWLSQVW